MAPFIENDLPIFLYEPLDAVNNAEENPADRHKKLLDLGESILHYLSGILFGEYKRSGDVNLTIETEFYNHSKRKPSLGVFQNFVRLLIKELQESLLLDKFEKGISYGSASELIFSFELLKAVIDEGADSEFDEKVLPLRKQRNAKTAGLLEFFDCFIQIRNTYAHPEDKAGLKANKRKWPLNEAYFNYINIKLENAIRELMECMDVLVNYPCATTAEIIDEQKQAKLLIEQGVKKKAAFVDLTDEQLKGMALDERYLLDQTGRIYSRLFYHSIPALNPSVAERVIAKEKASQLLPHLKQLIRDKLADDGRIDAIEYLVLWDTARLASYTENQLFELIDGIRKELQIDAAVGTPQNKGPLFIEKHQAKKRLSFSTYWLKHFLWVQKISIEEQKKEKDLINSKYDSKIERLTEELKKVPGAEKIKSIELVIRGIRENLKQLRMSKRDLPSTYSAKIKNASTEEKKEKYKQERISLEEKLEIRIALEEQKLEDQRVKLLEIKEKQMVQQADLQAQLQHLKSKKEVEYSSSTWGMHADIWKEFNQYVEGLLRENLNNEERSEDAGEKEQLWVNSPNSWQIGNLSHHYWAKIFQSNAPLGVMRHIGLYLGKSFKYVPKNIPEQAIKERLNDSVNIVLWTSMDDKLTNRIESSADLFIKHCNLCQSMVNNNASELQKLGLNVKCNEIIEEGNDATDLFVSLDYYLNHLKETHQIKQLYSRIYTLSDLYKDSQVDLSAVSDMENEIQALMSLFSNILNEVNDFAISMGLNQEEIKKREEQYLRYKKIMIKKFEETLTSTGFNPTKDQIHEWKRFANEELQLSDYSFNEIYGSYRWKK